MTSFLSRPVLVHTPTLSAELSLVSFRFVSFLIVCSSVGSAGAANFYGVQYLNSYHQNLPALTAALAAQVAAALGVDAARIGPVALLPSPLDAQFVRVVIVAGSVTRHLSFVIGLLCSSDGLFFSWCTPRPVVIF